MIDTKTGWRLAVGILFLTALTLVRSAAAAPAEDAARLSWLAGCWMGTADGVVTEEHWTSPGGGVLLGMNKAVAGDKLESFEQVRIAPQEQRLCYLASPDGAPATPFCAIAVGDDRVVFENKEHDFPQRVLYWREGAKLHARIEGTLGGKQEAKEWVWSRCAG